MMNGSAIMRSRSPISSFDHVRSYGDRSAPVVTAYSGGLDSCYLLHMLQKLGFDTIYAVVIDLGAPFDRAELEKSANHFGAEFVCIDGRSTFVEQAVKPALCAHARGFADYPISSSLSRPVIASLVVKFATEIGASLLLHTANLSQNSLPRLNNSIARTGFQGYFGSPYVESVIAREEKARVLAEAGLPLPASRSFSSDANLYCEEIEDGPLNDPENFEIPTSEFTWIEENCSYSKTQTIKLGFEDGNLVAIDDDTIQLSEAISNLNVLLGRSGHGLFVGLEHVFTGESVLEVRAAPAAAIIMTALRHLECASLSPRALMLKQTLEREWANEAMSGFWGSDVHGMSAAGIEASLRGVSGTVSMVISASGFQPRSIHATNGKYVRDRAEWEIKIARAGSKPLPPRDL